jgi:hypothetical protein
MLSYYTVAQVGFVAVTIIFIVWFLLVLRSGIERTRSRGISKRSVFDWIVIIVLAWCLFTARSASAGMYSDFNALPPTFIIVILIPLVLIIWATSTTRAREIFSAIPPERILFIQSFRILVEVFLWMLFVENVIPVQMTFEGQNFDILAGITGPVMGLIIQRKRSRSLLVVWNLICLALLINIVAVSILSAPLPFRVFMNEPANTFVTKFPFIWLPAVLVPLAYTLHIISLRQAFMMKK